jgi:hypothetical protein
LTPRDFRDHRPHALDRQRAADESLGCGVARHRRAFELQRRGDELAQIVQVERLRDEIESSELERAYGGLDVALNPFDELEPIAVGQAHVGQT